MKNLPNSLAFYAQAVPVNSAKVADLEPGIWRFAEAVDLAFQAVLATPFGRDEHQKWEELRWRLLQMAHIDWIFGYHITTSGQRSMGLMMHRRAIEFVAYASKISNDQRADIYLKKGEDPGLMRKFKGTFQIPGAFKNKKNYGHLWPLLGAWDLASDWGVHANFETTAFRDIRHGEIGHQDDIKKVLAAATIDVRLGLWLLEASAKLLDEIRPPSDDAAKKLEASLDTYRAFKLDILEKEPYKTQLEFWGGSDGETFAENAFTEAINRGPVKPTALELVLSALEDGELDQDERERLCKALGLGRANHTKGKQKYM